MARTKEEREAEFESMKSEVDTMQSRMGGLQSKSKEAKSVLKEAQRMLRGKQREASELEIAIGKGERLLSGLEITRKKLQKDMSLFQDRLAKHRRGELTPKDYQNMRRAQLRAAKKKGTG